MVLAVQGLGFDRDHPRSHSSVRQVPGEIDLELGPLFDLVLDAVVVARVTTGRIVAWNAAAEKLFGYTAEEVIGKSVEILMPEPIAPVHRAGMERYARTGHGLIIDADGPVEVPARTKQGEEIRVDIALTQLQSSKGERFVVALLRDAGFRRQIELLNLELSQTRIAQSEAESTLNARDELVESATTTLESNPSSEEQARLVRALQDFRRLKRGEMRIRAVDSDVVDIVHAACDAIRRKSPRRMLVYTPPLAPASFDPARLRQVLDQVLDEAVLRTSDGSRIEVRLEVLSPQIVQLSVRTDENTDPRPPGVGLQLSRTLVEAQGGVMNSDTLESGSLEVVMTLPGSPHTGRRRLSRARTPSRGVLAS